MIHLIRRYSEARTFSNAWSSYCIHGPHGYWQSLPRSFNNTQAQALGGHAIAAAVARAGIEPEKIDDVVMGAAMQQGSTAGNIARQSALRAGLPVSVAGMSIDRQCASGLMAVATGAKQIVADGMTAVVAGGLESISLVQNEHATSWRAGSGFDREGTRNLHEHAGNGRTLRYRSRSAR
jgi:acetyl-CoA acetyltransferase